MRRFAQKQNQAQQPASLNLTRPHRRAAPQASREAHPAPHSHGFAHDFSRIPAHAHQHLQTKRIQSDDSGEIDVPPIVHEVLRSSGQPLDTVTRGFMESRFGHDFSQVRVHTDARAAEAASAIDARAFTMSRDIVFGTGEYTPQNESGRRLLSHELTHVVQQQAGVQLKDGVSEAGDPNERHAEEVADEVAQGRSSEKSLGAMNYRNGRAALSVMRQKGKQTGKGKGLPDAKDMEVGYISKVVDQYGRGKFLRTFAMYNPYNYSDEQEACILDLEDIAARNGQNMNMEYFETFLQSVGMRANPKLNPKHLTYTLNPRLMKLQDQVWDLSPDIDKDLWKIGEDYFKKKLSTRQEAFLVESVEAKGFTRGEFFEWILYGLTGKPEKK